MNLPAFALKRRTLTNFLATLLAIGGVFAYFQLGLADVIFGLIGHVPMLGLVFLGAFLLVSWLAHSMARSETSVGMQYAGLFLYVLFQSIIFLPVLVIAQTQSIRIPGVEAGVNVVGAAAVTTLIMFGALTAFVFITRSDFSFLRTALFMGGIGAFALIVASIFIGMNLGVWFSVAMILLASGWILYDTSEVLHHHRTDQHVAASLELFASLALLFWYILRLFMALSGRD